MTQWIRFRHNGETRFGTLEGERVAIHDGTPFDGATPTGETAALGDVELLAPTEPTKVIALWNNFHALAAKLDVAEPAEPLYLLKAISSVTDPGAVVRRPKSYDGRVVYEGELGIVIGKKTTNVSEEDAAAHILGYTVVNDITAADLIQKDPTFPQWARAKGFDGFGPFGPVVQTDVDPASLVVRTVLNGQERQNYPISDMIFPAARLVSLLSHDMTLNPGDLIACGTSVGVGTMKEAVNTIEIVIDGIGTLTNTVEL
ncbi:fumarylacetoacetate hydrolase family protein [Terrihabitans sp. B22-R8]|uniref:fumarylacetoacetate hydrolase family protein n=1 Tax=Terrihabitans sp. B22-R8 TaxID=3425128 RepID=UPI00403CDBFC